MTTTPDRAPRLTRGGALNLDFHLVQRTHVRRHGDLPDPRVLEVQEGVGGIVWGYPRRWRMRPRTRPNRARSSSKGSMYTLSVLDSWDADRGSAWRTCVERYLVDP